MRIEIPQLSLVVLVGATGSGKSTFAARHFLPTEILNSDTCRAMVADDPTDQSATKDAFEVLHFIAAKRLAAGRLAVVDATNVQRDARRPLVELARRYHCIPVAIVLDVPEAVCIARNRERPDRDLPRRVAQRHVRALKRSLKGLRREGFRHVHVLRSPEEVDSVHVERRPLWCDRRDETGPFDLIGDVHGCADELDELLERLGYRIVRTKEGNGLDAGALYEHPAGRRAIFLGDLVDRGPRILDTVRIVRNMVEAGSGLCVPGNHDDKLVRHLRGRDVRITHGLDRTLAELDALPPEDRGLVEEQLRDFLAGLTSHYVLDGGALVVAHAGMREELQGRGSRKVRDFALYAETTGETDEFGLPVRFDWAAGYRGDAIVVYGHTPVPDAEWVNGTINIDTGCVFGGRLTALRYPERELLSVDARRTYAEPIRPAATPVEDDGRGPHVLDIEDVTGKRRVETSTHGHITIREEQSAAALEVMTRFAIDPRWLIHLPPTMSPTETSRAPGLLEHPAEAFAHYRERGIDRVVCQEKHMGSRAVLVVCRSPEVAEERFGAPGDRLGIVYTRTGRPFFDDELESQLLADIGDACGRADLWRELDTEWLCLDAEIMPWTVKAEGLVRDQYAPVGTAGRVATHHAVAALDKARRRGIEGDELLERYRRREADVAAYQDVYASYHWPVRSSEDLRVAPFHVLAAEGKTFLRHDHGWHMGTIARLVEAHRGDLLLEGGSRVVDVSDEEATAEATRWWERLTHEGAEGMVVKPWGFTVRGRRGLVQPALKCRGREYLRIIYGPEYTAPEHLERLRSRSVGRKRSLALREFALGAEALERFVRREPLWRVHECVFGVLALESEPVDPRL